jgi:hypothetical protein
MPETRRFASLAGEVEHDDIPGFALPIAKV